MYPSGTGFKNTGLGTILKIRKLKMYHRWNL
jgi:hypothetical protein